MVLLKEIDQIPKEIIEIMDSEEDLEEEDKIEEIEIQETHL